jgi:hypothetical protein
VKLSAIFLIFFSLQAMGRDIPLIADIEWNCEEGVGNLENPARLISIKGKFETTLSRQFSLEEKQQMTITVYEGGQPLLIDPSSYNLIWENDGDFQSLIIQIGDTTYRIDTTSGNALILRITRPGTLWGTITDIGSC